MKKRLLKFIGFAVLLVLVIGLLSHVYTRKEIDHTKYFAYSSTLAQFYNEPKDSMDVLAFGTSNISVSVLPPVLWEEAGITGYNVATPSQPAMAGYFWLKEALRYQSPKVVVLYGRWMFADKDIDDVESVYRNNTDAMRWSGNKLAFIQEILSESENQTFLDYLFPLFRFHDRTTLLEDDYNFAYLRKRHEVNGARLFYSNAIRKLAKDFRQEDREDRFVLEEKYLTKMIDLCKENNIQVVLVDTPASINERWSMAKHNALARYADQQGVPLLDFTTEELWNEIGFDETTDFADSNHCNILGGTKVTKYLAQYLSRTFSIERKKAEHDDPHWDEITEYYHDKHNRALGIQQLRAASTLGEYLTLLKEFPDKYAFISCVGDFTANLTKADRKALKALGLKTDFRKLSTHSYYAVINEGFVIEEECAEERLESEAMYMHPLTVTIKSLGYDRGDTTYTSNITINETQQSRNRQGFNIVVYDRQLERVVDSVCFLTSQEEVSINR